MGAKLYKQFQDFHGTIRAYLKTEYSCAISTKSNAA